MAEQSIPPWELTAEVPEGATPEECIAMWMDLNRACEQFLLAGLRREIGPDGDLRAAHRQWYAKHMEEHDRAMFHMMEEFGRRGGGHAR